MTVYDGFVFGLGLISAWGIIFLPIMLSIVALKIWTES